MVNVVECKLQLDRYASRAFVIVDASEWCEIFDVGRSEKEFGISELMMLRAERQHDSAERRV